MSDHRMAHRAINLATPPPPPCPCRRLVASQLAVGHPVRTGGLGAEPLDLVLLVRLEVALEPVPLPWVLNSSFPGKDVGCDSVQEPAIVADDHSAARKFEERVFE